MNPVRKNLTQKMFEHLNQNLPTHTKKRLSEDKQTLREVLECLSEFVLVEKRRQLIEFTNKVANGRKEGKQTEEYYERDEEKVSEFLDDLNELG